LGGSALRKHQLKKNVKKRLKAGWLLIVLVYLVDITIGGFCQLPVSHKDVLFSELIKIGIGMNVPHVAFIMMS
jgi:hypothetical protein